MPEESSSPEQWRPIPGWESLYEVSDHGRVRSLERRVLRKTPGKVPHSVPVRSRVLASTLSKGYPHLGLHRDGSGRTHAVHRLVLLAFVGSPEPGQATRHLDGNPGNNRLENLCWGTQSENLMDRVRHGTANRGERNGASKFTADDVREIRRLRSQGLTYSQIAERTGVSRGHAHRIATGDYWGWL